MKKFIYTLALSVALVSCSKEEIDPTLVEDIPAASETVMSTVSEANPATSEETAHIPDIQVKTSAAMRATFEVLKSGMISGQANTTRSSQDNVLCYQFVYPITLAYSDYTKINVTDYEQLIELLLNETTGKYLTGIGFPFSVTIKADGSQKVITDEEDFKALNAACGYDVIDYTYVVNAVSSCFEVSYPLDLNINDAVKTFESQQAAQQYFRNNWSSSTTVSISYPFRVVMTASGEKVSIANDFEMINLIKNTCGIE